MFGHYDYWKYETEVPLSVCKQIIEICEGFEKDTAKVGGPANSAVADQLIRKSQVNFWASYSWLGAMLYGFAHEANKANYMWELSGLETAQYTVYEAGGGHYTWHRDSGGPEVAPGAGLRKLSVVLALNDATEYEGGEFFLKNRMDDDHHVHELEKAGSVVVFPSHVLHTVQPVTKGTRRSLVGWVHGPRFV